MKTRYLSLDQFRNEMAEHKTAETAGMMIKLNPNPDEQLIVLAPSVPQIKALGGHDSRLIEFVITDETIDRMSDKLTIDGWETENFENNPVVLWAHSHYDPPVGRAVSLDILKKKKQVRSVTEFTPKELNPLGYMVYQMYTQKFMNAVSVGFFPKEYTWVSSEQDAERARRGGIDFLRKELLEYSAVPVPANPNALAQARSLGVDTAPMKEWAERVLDESTSRNLTDEARRRVEVLRAASAPSGRALILEIGDMKIKASDEQDPAAPPTKTAASVVKEVVTRRWDCGNKDHNHETKEAAEGCAEFDEGCDALARSVDALISVQKAGRVLSKKNEDALRSAAEAILRVLDQVKAKDDDEDEDEDEDDEGEEDDEDEEDEDEKSGVVAVEFADAGEQGRDKSTEQTISLDPADIKAAISEVVDSHIAKLTGRVD